MPSFLRPAVGFLLAAGLVLSGACWFERRPDPRNGEGADPATSDTSVVVTNGALRDSVRAVVTAFHDALSVGDGGRVAGLSVLGATVFDQEEGVAWRLGPGGGDLLPGPLVRGTEGLGWERSGTDFV